MHIFCPTISICSVLKCFHLYLSMLCWLFKRTFWSCDLFLNPLTIGLSLRGLLFPGIARSFTSLLPLSLFSYQCASASSLSSHTDPFSINSRNLNCYIIVLLHFWCCAKCSLIKFWRSIFLFNFLKLTFHILRQFALCFVLQIVKQFLYLSLMLM